MQELGSKDEQLFNAYVKEFGFVKIDYGTAGFRTKWKKLKHIAHRLGQFVATLQRYQNDKVLGIVISASHNEKEDNGFKITNAEGEMLEEQYEGLVSDFVNISTVLVLQKQMEVEYKIQQERLKDRNKKTNKVFVGYDNRESNKELFDLVKAGIESLGTECVDLGESTTPQIHFYVWYNNYVKAGLTLNQLQLQYDLKMVNHMQFILSKYQSQHQQSQQLIVDCANGIGGNQFSRIIEQHKLNLNIQIINKNDRNNLNDGCGSEYVQKDQKASRNIPISNNDNQVLKCCAFDGDADRLVYFIVDKGQCKVIEGDKMLVLYLITIIKLLVDNNQNNLSIGVVQTAYANGSSSKKISHLYGAAVQMEIEPTGVKYLHKASHKYDIGIYFESNGHGTILVKPQVLSYLKDTNLLLFNFLSLSNFQVGDAISNLLMVEAALLINSLNIHEFLNIYQDLYSQQLKIHVKNKQLIINNYQQTTIIYPPDIQPNIDAVINKYKEYQARAFVRPSGTEDVVRLYAEANSVNILNNIVQEIQQIIIQNKIINQFQ